MSLPDGMSLIVRTAGAQRPKPEIKRDCEYLLRLWDSIRERTLASTAPALIYEEADLIKRSIRDVFGRDIEEVLVEGDDAYSQAREFMRMLMPASAGKIRAHRDSVPLFARHNVDQQLDAMHSPVVQLRSGGYIVINQTEALVAIDVNSGRATRDRHIEDTALRTNLEAADEIARQLRLRDLAGLIVIDFIDMESSKHDGMVERRLKDALKQDRARIQVGRISHFGLLEMSRQRLRPGMIEASTAPCPHCHGTGVVRSAGLTRRPAQELVSTVMEDEDEVADEPGVTPPFDAPVEASVEASVAATGRGPETSEARSETGEEQPRRRRRRGRRGGRRSKDRADMTPAEQEAADQEAADEAVQDQQRNLQGDQQPDMGQPGAPQPFEPQAPEAARDATDAEAGSAEEPVAKPKRARRPRRPKPAASEAQADEAVAQLADQPTEAAQGPEPDADAPKPKRKRAPRKSAARKPKETAEAETQVADESAPETAPAEPGGNGAEHEPEDRQPEERQSEERQPEERQPEFAQPEPESEEPRRWQPPAPTPKPAGPPRTGWWRR
jgi:ribonuclease E